MSDERIGEGTTTLDYLRVRYEWLGQMIDEAAAKLAASERREAEARAEAERFDRIAEAQTINGVRLANIAVAAERERDEARAETETVRKLALDRLDRALLAERLEADLRAALGPLAEVAKMIGDAEDLFPSDEAFVHWAGRYPLTYGDARRAARALAASPSPEGPSR